MQLKLLLAYGRPQPGDALVYRLTDDAGDVAYRNDGDFTYVAVLPDFVRACGVVGEGHEAVALSGREPDAPSWLMVSAPCRSVSYPETIPVDGGDKDTDVGR